MRTLNIGRVESGLGTSRLDAICRSSSVFPRMVQWWTIWMLGAQEGDTYTEGGGGQTGSSSVPGQYAGNEALALGADILGSNLRILCKLLNHSMLQFPQL